MKGITRPKRAVESGREPLKNQMGWLWRRLGREQLWGCLASRTVPATVSGGAALPGQVPHPALENRPDSEGQALPIPQRAPPLPGVPTAHWSFLRGTPHPTRAWDPPPTVSCLD